MSIYTPEVQTKWVKLQLNGEYIYIWLKRISMTNSKFSWWNGGETETSHRAGYWRNSEPVSNCTLQHPFHYIAMWWHSSSTIPVDAPGSIYFPSTSRQHSRLTTETYIIIPMKPIFSSVGNCYTPCTVYRKMGVRGSVYNLTAHSNTIIWSIMLPSKMFGTSPVEQSVLVLSWPAQANHESFSAIWTSPSGPT